MSEFKSYTANYICTVFGPSFDAYVKYEDHSRIVAELKAEVERLNQKYDFQLLVKSNEALTSKLQKAVEALKSVQMNYVKEHLNVTSCDNVGDKVEAALKEIGVES